MDAVYRILQSNFGGHSSLPVSFISPVPSPVTPRQVRQLISALMYATDQTNDVMPQIIAMIGRLAAYHKFTHQTWKRATIGCFEIAAKQQQLEEANELDIRTSKVLGVRLDILQQIEKDLIRCLEWNSTCEVDSMS